ncbi:MAG: hypothetical protein U5L45_21690 [Saprospiraceae bacterium]|nr:hypothetical protein [Saprospiraceae bacterium]
MSSLKIKAYKIACNCLPHARFARAKKGMWFIFRLCRKMNHLFSYRCARKRYVAK